MIEIILMEPETSGNVGAIARSMKNFKTLNLTIINPQCNIHSEEAIRRSKHAKEILKKAKIVTKKQGERYLKKLDTLVGTSAKIGTEYNILRTPLTAKELSIELIKNKIPTKRLHKCGILIGREGIGLTNEELKVCDFLVTIPSNIEYPVLNISHATTIIMYEIFQASHNQTLLNSIFKTKKLLSKNIEKNKNTKKEKNTKKDKKESSHTNELHKDTNLSRIILANRKEKDVLLKEIDKVITKTKFATEDKRVTQRKVWQRLVGKGFMTKREIYAIIGFFKKLK